jgi:transposase
MIESQDGGIPLACMNCDGNSADTAVFKARSKALVDSFKSSKTTSYLIADGKLYYIGNAEFLSQLQFITLIPSTIKHEKELISSKLSVFC